MGSPYRAVAAPTPPRITVFRGKDAARWSIALWLFLVAPFVPFAGRVGVPALWAAAGLVGIGWALHAADRPTRRYELRIDEEGYRLRRYRFGFLLTSVRRVSLEWEARHVEPWDDYEPAGIHLVPPRRLLRDAPAPGPSVPSFGPVETSAEVREMVLAIGRAVHDLRASLSARDHGRERSRRSGDVAVLWDSVDAASVERNSWGRARRMRLCRGASWGGIRLPAGTLVEMEFAEEWQSPDTPDRITAVTLGARAPWGPFPVLLRAGARVELDGRRRIHRVTGACEGTVRVRDVRVDGMGPMTFDPRGRLTACTLGAPIEWGPLRLAAGTRVSLFAGWRVTFGGPGVTIKTEPQVDVITAEVELSRRGKRATLAEILRSPRRSAKSMVWICERIPGAPPRSAHTHHSVDMNGQRPPPRKPR